MLHPVILGAQLPRGNGKSNGRKTWVENYRSIPSPVEPTAAAHPVTLGNGQAFPTLPAALKHPDPGHDYDFCILYLLLLSLNPH